MFWNKPSDSPLLKQTHRWLVYFGDAVEPVSAASITKPNFDISYDRAIHSFNTPIIIPKNLVWNPIKISLYDIYEIKESKYEKSQSLEIFNKLKKSGTNKPQQKASSQTSARQVEVQVDKMIAQFISPGKQVQATPAKPPASAKVNVPKEKATAVIPTSQQNGSIVDNQIIIKELDEYGNAIDTWTIINPMISSVTFSELNYSRDDVSLINLEVFYDYAENTIITGSAKFEITPIDYDAFMAENKEKENKLVQNTDPMYVKEIISFGNYIKYLEGEIERLTEERQSIEEVTEPDSSIDFGRGGTSGQRKKLQKYSEDLDNYNLYREKIIYIDSRINFLMAELTSLKQLGSFDVISSNNNVA